MADLLSSGFQNFSLNHHELLKTAPNDDCIIVSLAQQPPSTSPGLIAACTMSSHIYLLHSTNLSVSSLLDLNPAIRGGRRKRVFSHARFGVSALDPYSLFAVSQDEGVFRWDVRIARQPAQAFECSSISSFGLQFLSMDLNCDGRLLVAGSSAMPKGDAYIGFWDARFASCGAFLGVYSDSHSQDVTALAFHPSKAGYLLSGAGDGLLCRFDLIASKEDDALIMSCNVERSLARVGWTASNMFCISDMNTFHLWDADGDLQQEITALPKSWQYIVDYLSNSKSLLVGNHAGELALLRGGGEAPCRLIGGHSDTVRSALVTSEGDLVTGGEDGMVCVWQRSESGALEPTAKKQKLNERRKKT